jgi:uncharacterized membrane protein
MGYNWQALLHCFLSLCGPVVGAAPSTLNRVSFTHSIDADAQNPRFEWVLRRHAPLSPAQMLVFFASLSLVSLSIGLFFWLQGALLVLPFAALEILAVGICFLIFSRHVLDQERIVVDGFQVVVEHEAAGVRERAQFHRQWVRIEPLGGEHSLIAVSGQGKTMQVGRYVRPERREALAHELRRAVRMG